MIAISLIMPCYNRSLDLTRILNAYDQQDVDQGFEIIAVDDASSDDTFNVLNSYHPARFNLRVERHQENQGPAAARNRGIELATAPLIAFVGDDILPAPDFVSAHLAAHRQYPQPEIAILGKVVWPEDMPVNTLMRHIDGPGAQQFSYHYFQNGQEYDFRQFYTANISVKAALLHQSDHWFDTSFSFAAFEDAELAYRLAKHGLRIIFDNRPVGRHYHYHTVWTFVKRQYRAGVMACKVAEKHPELANLLRVKKTRQLFILRLLHPWPRNSGKDLSETAGWLEQQMLFMSSSYEWFPHGLLDEFYLTMLEYYWRQGLLAGVFGHTPNAEMIRQAYAVYYLGDFLRNFIPRAQQANIPVTIGGVEELNAKLAGVESDSVKYLRKFWHFYGYQLTRRWFYADQVPV